MTHLKIKNHISFHCHPISSSYHRALEPKRCRGGRSWGCHTVCCLFISCFLASLYKGGHLALSRAVVDWHSGLVFNDIVNCDSNSLKHSSMFFFFSVFFFPSFFPPLLFHHIWFLVFFTSTQGFDS